MKINILGYVPARWRDCIGNKTLIKMLRDIIRQIRFDKIDLAKRLFVSGPSRSGKTATIKLFIKALLCERLDPMTLDPCGSCRSCLQQVERYGERGVETYLAESRFHYVPIDCTKVTGAKELIELLRELRDYDGTRVVYLDEIHRLQQRCLDEQLLKPVDELGFIWIASSAQTEALDEAFLNRFTKVKTELPSQEELALWLADRCIDFDIRNESEALIRLTTRSDRIAGIALQALEQASLDRQTGLTLELVEGWTRDFDQ
jgi:replication-associated recombination protein RarA